jgi:hypothetical protein
MVPRSVSASVPRPPQAQPAALYEPFTPVIGDGWGGVILNPDPPGPRSELPFISGDPYTEGRLEAL